MRRHRPARARAALSILCGAVLLFAAGVATAQNPFALSTLGVDISTTDARIDGRGGWGIAEQDTVMPSFHSLACLPGLKKVAVVISGYGELSQSEGTGFERRTSTVRTPTLRAALPFRGGDVVASVGFRSLRGTQYSWNQDVIRVLEGGGIGGEGEIVEGFFAVTREGTQFEVPLGVGARLHDRLSVGWSLNLVNGVIRERVTEGFYDDESDGNVALRSNSEVLEDALTGTSTTLSVQGEPVDGVALGASFTPAYDWNVARTRDMSGIPGEVNRDFVIGMPAAWTVGGAVDLGERWRVGAEYERQDYTSLTGSAWDEGEFADAWRFGVGVERREAYRRRGGRGNLPLRLGYARRVLPFLVSDKEVVEQRISVGTGVPFRDQNGHLDVAVSYVMTGDAAEHGVSDRTWRLTVSLAGLERWW